MCFSLLVCVLFSAITFSGSWNCSYSPALIRMQILLCSSDFIEAKLSLAAFTLMTWINFMTNSDFKQSLAEVHKTHCLTTFFCQSYFIFAVEYHKTLFHDLFSLFSTFLNCAYLYLSCRQMARLGFFLTPMPRCVLNPGQ